MPTTTTITTRTKIWYCF